MTVIDSFDDERWVRVMTDYCASPVWNRDGLNADLGDLPVSRETADALTAWEDWFDCRPSDDPIPNAEAFVDVGRRLACTVKRELPDWTVVYHDTSLYDSGTDADVEITPSAAEASPPPPSVAEIRALGELG